MLKLAFLMFKCSNIWYLLFLHLHFFKLDLLVVRPFTNDLVLNLFMSSYQAQRQPPLWSHLSRSPNTHKHLCVSTSPAPDWERWRRNFASRRGTPELSPLVWSARWRHSSRSRLCWRRSWWRGRPEQRWDWAPDLSYPDRAGANLHTNQHSD